MWTTLERSIDGVVGRMLSWLAQPPARALPGVEDAAAPPVEEVEPAVEEVEPVEEVDRVAGSRDASDTIEAFVEAAGGDAKEAAVELGSVAEAADRATDETLDRFVEGVERSPEEGDELSEKVLAALATSSQGATLAILRRRTGGQPGDLQAVLQRLIAAGQVELETAGMTKRYRRVAE